MRQLVAMNAADAEKAHAAELRTWLRDELSPESGYAESRDFKKWPENVLFSGFGVVAGFADWLSAALQLACIV